MLLTISTTHAPATDLGFLLHKNPGGVRSVELGFGTAHVFYPEAGESRATAALLVEVDPIGLARGRRGPVSTLEPYVNDRPYVASSFTAVAIGKLFGTAMSGRSKERPELAEAAIPLEARVAVLPARGGEDVVRRLFEPLGYDLTVRQIPADDGPGDSGYVDLTLRQVVRLRDLLSHLYVLLPVLDDQKHYWVSRDEVDKLLLRGEGWLGEHPERELITRRYLRHSGQLTREALGRLLEEDQPDPDAEGEVRDREEEAVEETIGLAEQRRGAVAAVLRSAGARRVLDLGCGSGKLLKDLLADGQFTELVGVDVAMGVLQMASRTLRLDQMSPAQRARITLLQSSLTYRDTRLQGYDAAVAMEVVEHLDPSRLDAFARVLFESDAPGTVIVTTPNVEYNARFEGLPAGELRHRDHRFEWTRAEFQEWANAQAGRYGYAVRFLPVGPQDAELGAPTQMAVFSR